MTTKKKFLLVNWKTFEQPIMIIRTKSKLRIFSTARYFSRSLIIYNFVHISESVLLLRTVVGYSDIHSRPLNF